MRTKSKILVLGATGNVGSPLVEELVRRRASVRAAVRSPEKSARLAGLRGVDRGVEWVRFDFTNPSTYESAFAGVESAYLLTPVVENQAALTQALVDAAKSAGIRRIVKQSAHGVDSSEGVRLLREHRDAEKIVEDSGIPFVFLRPTGFFQNFLGYAEEISMAGVFHMALGSDRAAHIDARDVALCAATVLTRTGDEGKKYNLTGGEALSNEDIADILSETTGDQIKYVPISDEVELRDLKEEGTPDWLAHGLVELFRFWREENAAQPTMDVREITGRDPRRFDQFARDFAERFKRRAVA